MPTYPLCEAAEKGDLEVSVPVMRGTRWLQIIYRPGMHSLQHPPPRFNTNLPIPYSLIKVDTAHQTNFRAQTHACTHSLTHDAHSLTHVPCTHSLAYSLTNAFSHIYCIAPSHIHTRTHTQANTLTRLHTASLHTQHHTLTLILSKWNGCWPQASNPMPKKMMSVFLVQVRLVLAHRRYSKGCLVVLSRWGMSAHVACLSVSLCVLRRLIPRH